MSIADQSVESPASSPTSAARTDEPIRFFLTGPTWVRPDVLEAMRKPMIGHRSPDFKQLYASLAPRLQRVMRTRGDVLLATGSATLVMESAVRSLVSGAVLNLTSGAFSERWQAISRSVGVDTDTVSAPWGRAIDPDQVRAALKRRRYDAVTLVHNETSTGVMNPLADIAAAVREESDALMLVDTVSSLGGARVEVDDWGLDVVLAGLQKALAAPPGLVAFTLSDRAALQAGSVENRGFFTDLVRYRDKHRAGGTITTPAIPVVYALDRQLDVILEEGMAARWRRHVELAEQTESWASENGFEYASHPSARSRTVACLRPPEGVSAPELVAGLRDRGIVVGGGYGEWKPHTFRIGHMGEVRSHDLEALFGVIGSLL